MNQRVLVVDDEEQILNVLLKLIKPTFKVATAQSGPEGLRVLEDLGEAAVVISDFKMPGMDGIEFLREVREKYPDTIRIILTGYADEEVAIQAVNRGHVFRFLTKPIDRNTLLQAVAEGVQQYNMNTAEKDLIEKTLQSSVQVLTELLGMAEPVSYSRAGRMYRYVRDMGRALEFNDRWPFEIAALLSQIGCVSLPKELIQKSLAGFARMDDAQVKQFQAHASVGANILQSIPRLELVAKIIRRQFTTPAFSLEDYQRGLIPEEEIGAQLLAIAFNYDVERMHDKPHATIIDEMRRDSKTYFFPFVDALNKVTSSREGGGTRRINLQNLEAGMVLAADVRTEKDVLVATQGQEVTPTMIQRINAFHTSHGIRLPLMVHVEG